MSLLFATPAPRPVKHCPQHLPSSHRDWGGPGPQGGAEHRAGGWGPSTRGTLIKAKAMSGHTVPSCSLCLHMPGTGVQAWQHPCTSGGSLKADQRGDAAPRTSVTMTPGAYTPSWRTTSHFTPVLRGEGQHRARTGRGQGRGWGAPASWGSTYRCSFLSCWPWRSLRSRSPWNADGPSGTGWTSLPR